MSDLGEKIRLARRSADHTQVSFAERMGVDSITVSRWERGITQPSLTTLRRISAITKVPLSDLVSGEGTSNVILDELKLLREEVAEIKRILRPR